MFKTAKGVPVSRQDIIEIISDYIMKEPAAEYCITVGTDSQTFADATKMVEVIAICRVGCGGIFFHNIEYVNKMQNLKQKINEETSRSLTVANGLVDELGLALLEQDIDIDEMNINFQIHCDIGRSGKTKMLIKDIVSWVTSQGYECHIKPDSYTASAIANKYSK